MQMLEAIEHFVEWRSFKRRARTLKGDSLQLRYFCMHVRNCEVESIELEQILDWMQLMRTLGFDDNTIAKKATVLRVFFDFYRKKGHDVLEPMLIPVPPKKYRFPRVATKEEYGELLNVIPKRKDHWRNKAMVMTLWDTGARLGEIISLDVSDIDLDRKKAVIQTEKSRGTRPIRELFWTKETNTALGNWIEYRRELAQMFEFLEPDALFISVKGGHKTNSARGRRTATNAFGEILRKYSNKAGLEVPLNAHSMRHHMGHHIIQKGGTNADVMNILGHTSIQSTTTYTMMKDRELEKRYRKFKGE